MSISPALYCSMILFRSDWRISPCRQAVFSPWACSCSATMPVVYLVLQKTMARDTSNCFISRRMISIFSRPMHRMLYWSIFGSLSCTGSTVISSGSRWYSQPMSMTSREMVAENIHICLSPFKLSKILRTSL